MIINNKRDSGFKESVDSIAREIRDQAQDMKVDTFLSYLYTADIINRYMYMILGDEQVSRAGFTILHFLILNNGSLLPTELSKKSLRSKYAVTRAIDTLEKQKFVERLPIGEDRRNRKVVITRKGLEVVRNATIDSRGRLSQNIFRFLGEKKLEELNTTLKLLRKHVLTLIDELKPE